MAASLFDSPNYAKLFPVGDAGRLFTDTAEVRAMMLVEGTLAILQGKAGTIPEISAQAIHRASLELQIDPAGLSDATGIVERAMETRSVSVGSVPHYGFGLSCRFNSFEF